jgi:hypothetical protein
MNSMSEPSAVSASGRNDDDDQNKTPPTVAAFSPTSHSPSSTRHRSTILVHQKSPLLLATPPQVTRALAYSHPFIIPLNKLVGLLSWTTGDAWESFLFVAAFWFALLYGDYILRYTGPLILVVFLIVGMYLRRYSPLSSTGWTGPKEHAHGRDAVKHRKSLDEILSTLQTFTTRCNMLLDPLLRLTDFLSTQQTATSATTQPALTTLFIRIMLASPVWFALTLPPLRIITTKRMIMVFGTIFLSWHSRPARISRTILWRSKTVREICTVITGLHFGPPPKNVPPLPPRPGSKGLINVNARPDADSGESIRFTFTLYENQRRWLGIGWTTSMLAYERNCWTDEHLNSTADPTHFSLPEVEGGMAKWQWVQDSDWHIEAPPSRKIKSKELEEDTEAWVYYDNKWRDGRRGQDGWGRYTRRRKWLRDAELVDVTPAAEEATPRRPSLQRNHGSNLTAQLGNAAQSTTPTLTNPSSTTTTTTSTATNDTTSPSSSYKRSSWIRERATSGASSSNKSESTRLSRLAGHADDVVPPVMRLKSDGADWGLGDDVSMGLG